MSIWTQLFGKRCAECRKTLNAGSGGLVISGDMDAIAERINSRPTYCHVCAKHFCIGCAFKAGQSKGDASLRCPSCGQEVPQNYSF